MISEKIVDMIKENADTLTNRLCKDLLSREETKGYRALDKDIVYERVYDVYSRLDNWLAGNKKKGEVKEHYRKLGMTRFHEGIALSEVVMALMLIKRHLWLYVQETHFFDSSFQLMQALEFNNRVVLFFDRAIFFTCIGYQEEEQKCLGKPKEGFISRVFK
ncbi:MAG TPA: hypothetical protein PLT09_02040 [Deltaproteobacteria bacterium]|nr:hypothetical protein [Deltaproteobacteria bacterium]HPR56229.1 hypothetical protein [Deltaproteobacteria bacterium]HXK46194.1 hypothetical protein [Deltaproteobacteria bacterium]